jgi:hypothetical protein
MKRSPCQAIAAWVVSPSSSVVGQRSTAMDPRFPRGSVILLFALVRGERGSPAHEGSRRVGVPSTQRLLDSSQVNIRSHPPVEPAREQGAAHLTADCT